jgi:hypothetical protein
MLGYRKRSFADAHGMLATLRANLADLGTLKALQQLLYREIVRTEKKIRELKAERKGVMKAGGRRAGRRSSILLHRVEKARHCAYVWRCFGDAIAFSYMDKFALKHCYYSTERARVKQSAGFLSDKVGMATEIAWLEFALDQKTPALLVDLTDTIRHGDICLMDEADPLLIEVKAGSEMDRRGRRQKRSLAKLRQFFETDRVRDLRGIADVRRKAFAVAERNYADEIEACIGDAMKNGHSVRTPERGLHYIAMADNAPAMDDILTPLVLTKPLIFQLNEFKAERAWAPYYPFVLSISIADRDYLWAFSRGEVYLLVILEQDRLCEIAKEKGYGAEVDVNNEQHMLTISIPSTDKRISVSSHFLRRIGLEFASPEWVVAAAIEMLCGGDMSVTEALAQPDAADFEFTPPRIGGMVKPANLG